MGAIVLRLKLVLQLHRQGQVRSDSQLFSAKRSFFTPPMTHDPWDGFFCFHLYMNFVDLYGKLVGKYISHMDAMGWEPGWVS